MLVNVPWPVTYGLEALLFLILCRMGDTRISVCGWLPSRFLFVLLSSFSSWCLFLLCLTWWCFVCITETESISYWTLHRHSTSCLSVVSKRVHTDMRFTYCRLSNLFLMLFQYCKVLPSFLPSFLPACNTYSKQILTNESQRSMQCIANTTSYHSIFLHSVIYWHFCKYNIRSNQHLNSKDKVPWFKIEIFKDLGKEYLKIEGIWLRVNKGVLRR